MSEMVVCGVKYVYKARTCIPRLIDTSMNAVLFTKGDSDQLHYEALDVFTKGAELL